MGGYQLREYCVCIEGHAYDYCDDNERDYQFFVLHAGVRSVAEPHGGVAAFVGVGGRSVMCVSSFARGCQGDRDDESLPYSMSIVNT
jgi:hypothetical protein